MSLYIMQIGGLFRLMEYVLLYGYFLWQSQKPPGGKAAVGAAVFPSEGFSVSIIVYRKLFSQLTRESCQILSATVFLIWSVTGPLLAIFPRIAA